MDRLEARALTDTRGRSVEMMNQAANPGAVRDYWMDAWQRGILFLDTLRERGDTYREQAAKEVPHVLNFPAELVKDGRDLDRPVNYALVRIVPSEGVVTDPAKPPVVVVDPRAGHGPGIGGMKPESEIGVALGAGHPVYFIGFLPKPMDGQTIEDVCRAEAVFIEEVAARHPEAEGKPIVIANCQAGWQIMMAAAMRPDLMGPIMLAGAPLSYWAGVRGKNPMRYLGGVLGGAWLAALSGDLGAGIFDGANLVANFEQLNPANTYWTKPYNVYAKIDTEPERFLEFETWWGSPVLLNAGEMQWIVDNLFVGNKLSAGEIRASDGARIDLRAIKSPIVVFCSWGDDITPPQQALGWILDLYDDVDDLVAAGQTIVYSLHQSIGHLGIFVSGKIAAKEHREFVSCMEMIDLLPPGLYEAVITEAGEDTENRELVDGKYLFRLEARTLDDIRAFGVNDAGDDKRFEAVERLSEVNLGLYRTLAQPWLRACVTEPMAEAMRAMHPNRLRFGAFSSENPFMAPVKPLADMVRACRAPVRDDNPLLAMEKAASDWITAGLRIWGEARDSQTEAIFLNTYGSPLVQAALGLNPGAGGTDRRIGRDLVREAAAAERRSNLEGRFDQGGLEEAALRALIYVRLPGGAFDERGYRMLKSIRESRKANERLSLSRFKAMLREQFQLLSLDEERAIEALPKLVKAGAREAGAALDAVRRVVTAAGQLDLEGKRRLKRIEALLEPGPRRSLAHG